MIIYIYIIAHLIADFNLQPAELAQKKQDKFSFLVIHSIIYAAVFSIVIFTFISFEIAILPFIIIIVSHFLIDWVRKIIDKSFCKKVIVFASFLIDQILHIAILVYLVYVFDLNTKTNHIYDYMLKWEYFNNLIIYALIYVIIWDTTAVFMKKLFAYICNKNECANEENDPRVGRVIGKLERLIISSLVLCNQLGAIGFVLAAKSIARYKQLEDKNFAEKYLVGTLASASIAFITAILLKKLI